MKPIRSVAALLVLALAQPATAEPAASEFQLYQVTREAIAMTLSFAGTVSADKTLQLTAQMPGRIAYIAGQEGDAFDSGGLNQVEGQRLDDDVKLAAGCDIAAEHHDEDADDPDDSDHGTAPVRFC